MGIFEWELWDEAGSGAKGQDEEARLPALNLRDEKSGLSGFWRFCVVIGSLSRHLTFYDSKFA